MVRESKIVSGRPAIAGPAEHVFAYGDPDDAPRLMTVLAARLRHLADAGSAAAQDAERCLDPRATWKDRLAGLEAALDGVVHRPDAPTFVLWDADALAASHAEAFDVERSSLLRRDLFLVVRASAEAGGWILVRTARATGSQLDDVDVRRHAGDVLGGPLLPEQAQLFASECQPLAAWLVRNQVVRPEDLAAITRTVAQPDTHLVDLVYQELPAALRDAAKLLSGLRAPQVMNGHYGRVAFSDGAKQVTGHSVPTAARDRLQDCGFLQTTPSGCRVPRLVRERLYHLAEATLAAELEELHHREAAVGAAPGITIDDSVEAHHHALLTGDIELAKSTARYYGNELCDVARRLSAEARDAVGAARKARFRRAADLYQFILDNYDPEDAYAWEYRGYNLALAGGPPSEVLTAYRRAYAKRFHNPLYHGRLVGFRGELGEDVVAEAIAGIREYAQHDPTREPVSFFAKTVFDGLGRGGRQDQLRAIVAACAPILREHAPKLLIGE